MAHNPETLFLQAKNIRMEFPGVIALDNVNLDVYASQVNALVGENGAGKSTLIKILSGIYRNYEGTVLYEGKPVSFNNARDAQYKGIAVIHQELNLIPNISVAENIFLGREYTNKLGMIDYKRLQAETSKLLSELDPDISPSALVSELRVGQQQIVEIAKALSLNARLIIMDEPTSAISDKEVELLFKLIDSMKKTGVTFIYITHKMDELFKIADRITVLRDGRHIGSAVVDQISSEDIIRMMVGRDLDDVVVREQGELHDEIFRIENMTVPHPTRANDFLVQDVSFALNKGEILGVFGLMGAGRTELCDAVFGVYSKKTHGRIYVEGQSTHISCPGDAIAAGIGYIPEDRKRDGLVLDMNIAENISMASIEQVEHYGFLNDRKELTLADRYMKQLRIKAPSPNYPVGKLSGGNQQKVVIAKWLATDQKILLLDEPTRGIDIRAKKEIYNLIFDLASKGLGVVVVSSELPEILAVSDRIIVLSEGRVTGEYSAGQATKELLLEAAIPRQRIINQDSVHV